MKIINMILVMIAILTLAMSYNFSDQTDYESLKRSDWVLEKFQLVTNQEIADESGNYPYYSRLMREVAHVVLYIFITLSIYLAFYAATKRNFLSILFAFLVVMGYAWFDEIHQEQIDGRGYEWLDIVLDFIGCSICLFVAGIVTELNRVQFRGNHSKIVNSRRN